MNSNNQRILTIVKFIFYWVFSWWLMMHDGDASLAVIFAFVYAWIIFGVANYKPDVEKNEKSE